MGKVEDALLGLKLFDKKGSVVLKIGLDWVEPEVGGKTHTVYLENGERVIGYKSRSSPDFPNHAYHFDFQLIIGRLE